MSSSATLASPAGSPNRPRRVNSAVPGALWRLVARWVLLAALTTIAFWETLSTLVDTTRQDGLNG